MAGSAIQHDHVDFSDGFKNLFYTHFLKFKNIVSILFKTGCNTKRMARNGVFSLVHSLPFLKEDP